MRALARIDDGAITRNCTRLTEALGPAALCAVVKADGYGHGMVESARAAHAGGASLLAVATATEATALRDAEIDGVLVMGALSPAELVEAAAARAEVVVWDLDYLPTIARVARQSGTRIGVHVKFDSGMGRLGARDPMVVHELAERISGDAHLSLAGAMTHFATADERGDDHFPTQLRRFTEVVEQLKQTYPALIAHAANSAAVLRDPASHFDMARCGVAIYGLDPFGVDPALVGLEPALRLSSYVAAVKALDSGDSVGYGRTWIAEAPTSIAVLPIGYGDGVRRGLSDNGEVLIGGRRYPLVGTVSMDNVTVDLGPEPVVAAGEEAVLIGAQGSERILCEMLAKRLDTINYEVTCGVGVRVPREHLSA
ncbi:MAG: alanine racemase [Thermoleophilaceae bacterium]|nr:alanine racemase [Thermoleophilaceae bacterium]